MLLLSMARARLSEENALLATSRRIPQKMMEDAGFKTIECGITLDIRPGRAEEKWVNVIVGKA